MALTLKRAAHIESPGWTRIAQNRHPLEPLVAGRLSEEVQADCDELLRLACEHGLEEGIIAKHVEKPYCSGRGDWW